MITAPEIFEKTPKFSVSQHEDRRNFVLDFGYRSLAISFCELLFVREQVARFSAHENLVDMIEQGHSEILRLCNNEHFFILSSKEVIELQTLLSRLFQK